MSTKNLVVRSILIPVFVVVLAGVVSAATIEVRQLGCASPNCYSTISGAIAVAQQNDTIKVYPGRYEEAVVIGKNLTLIGSGPQVTTIYSTVDGIMVNANITVTISGFTITSAAKGIYLKSGSISVIRNNTIVSNGGTGIYFGCSSTKSTIINNVVSYNSSHGIQSYDDSWLCTNYVYIYNNIITNNGGWGLLLPDTSEIISYNNVYSNTTGNYSNCSAGTGDIAQNPSFIAPSNGNFALQNTSTSINAGRLGSADADPDGTRNDMGAYGGPDAAGFWPYPPGAPIITNLTISPTSVQKGGTITINATGEIR